MNTQTAAAAAATPERGARSRRDKRNDGRSLIPRAVRTYDKETRLAHNRFEISRSVGLLPKNVAEVLRIVLGRFLSEHPASGYASLPGSGGGGSGHQSGVNIQALTHLMLAMAATYSTPLEQYVKHELGSVLSAVQRLVLAQGSSPRIVASANAALRRIRHLTTSATSAWSPQTAVEYALSLLASKRMHDLKNYIATLDNDMKHQDIPHIHALRAIANMASEAKSVTVGASLSPKPAASTNRASATSNQRKRTARDAGFSDDDDNNSDDGNDYNNDNNNDNNESIHQAEHSTVHQPKKIHLRDTSTVIHDLSRATSLSLKRTSASDGTNPQCNASQMDSFFLAQLDQVASPNVVARAMFSSADSAASSSSVQRTPGRRLSSSAGSVQSTDATSWRDIVQSDIVATRIMHSTLVALSNTSATANTTSRNNRRSAPSSRRKSRYTLDSDDDEDGLEALSHIMPKSSNEIDQVARHALALDPFADYNNVVAHIITHHHSATENEENKLGDIHAIELLGLLAERIDYGIIDEADVWKVIGGILAATSHHILEPQDSDSIPESFASSIERFKDPSFVFSPALWSYRCTLWRRQVFDNLGFARLTADGGWNGSALHEYVTRCAAVLFAEPNVGIDPVNDSIQDMINASPSLLSLLVFRTYPSVTF
ncbi:hypothetical protein GQ42DRAFT_178677 [Ramicandelaber brevisporus]|nr:hypothetical protein GQ42DRAFT_178677 [Ramicandelaber brevisporus]